MGEALERTVEAGRSLIVRRMDLLAAETRSLLHDGGMLLAAVAIALIGWIYLVHALTLGLSELYPRSVVEVAVGLAHVVAALLLYFFTRDRQP
jgi:hypothetical protein